MRKRLEHGATPLIPWSTTHPDYPGQSYYKVALDRIDAKVASGLEKYTKGFALDDTLVQKLGGLGVFMHSTLSAAHANRMDYQHDMTFRVSSLTGEAVEYALDGRATPHELVTLFLDNPPGGLVVDTEGVAVNKGVKALELSKLTHPFDWDSGSVTAMEDDLDNALSAFTSANSPPKYRMFQFNSELCAMRVLRKQVLVKMVNFRGDTAQVIRRDNFVVWGDERVRIGHHVDYLHRRIKHASNDDRAHAEVEELIEREISLPVSARGKWLLPATTSFYGTYTPGDSELDHESEEG